jgi:selenide, water dikinase
MGPGDLVKALAPLPLRADPRILVGRETFDDAGVFRLSDDVALVQTLDFFAAIVDDPFEFGQIAAANALSDVYAMGGEPLTALSIVGFPTGRLPLDVLTEILRGGQEKVHEAGAVVIGGHSVIDDEVKYGLSVTGRIDPRHMLTNDAARAGDVLVLTKPLGTGFVTTALKRALIDREAARDALDAMRVLNADAAKAALDVGAVCATDVTGFGLAGHASHIARASNVTARLRLASLPAFASAHQSWRAGASPGGADRNTEFLQDLVDWQSAGPFERALVVDPQTSGGLLVAVSPPRVDEYLSRVPKAAVVGEIVPRGERLVALT